MPASWTDTNKRCRRGQVWLRGIDMEIVDCPTAAELGYLFEDASDYRSIVDGHSIEYYDKSDICPLEYTTSVRVKESDTIGLVWPCHFSGNLVKGGLMIEATLLQAPGSFNLPCLCSLQVLSPAYISGTLWVPEQ